MALLAGSAGLVALLGVALTALVLMYVLGSALRIVAIIGLWALIVVVPVMLVRRMASRSRSRGSD